MRSHSPPLKGRGARRAGRGMDSAFLLWQASPIVAERSLHNQEYPFSEKVTDPTPNPSPTREGRTSRTILQGRGELRGLSYKGGENLGEPRGTGGTVLQGRGELRGLSYKGRGELRGLSYKGGENFGDYPTREGRTSGTILQGRGAAAYSAMQQGRLYKVGLRFKVQIGNNTYKHNNNNLSL